MTDAEIIADMFGPPCNFSPADEEVTMNCDCEHICGSAEQTDAKCWQRYFEYKGSRNCGGLTWKDICRICEVAAGMLGKNINDELMGRYESPQEFYEKVLEKI